jgi:hypothetical protein
MLTFVFIRAYDRRGSNSTMYTSIESLNRVDSMLMPPPASSPGSYRSNSNRCPSPIESRRRDSMPPFNSQLQQTYEEKLINFIHFNCFLIKSIILLIIFIGINN